MQLGPGHSLVLYSDGLVEREDHVLPMGDLEAALGGATDAAEMVGRLMGRVPDRPLDHVTVVVLRRLTQDGAEAGGAVRVLVAAGATAPPRRSP